VTDLASRENRTPTGSPLLWALFLGASWTWIIGMFVPVLLVRDHGLWGWIVFAIPNVVGAAAMAWVLRDSAASAEFVERHRSACQAFSLVTIAFHIFFAMWMIERIKGWGLMTLGICLVASLLPGRNFIRFIGAAFAMMASGVAWWMIDQQGMLALPSVRTIGNAGWLLPAFIVGFLVCPYLDLTFHRARQMTSPGGGRLAFAIGFGVVFFSMIVFTLFYARWLAPAVEGHSLGQLSTLFVSMHLMAQSAFTVAMHTKELPCCKSWRFSLGFALMVVAAAALGWMTSTSTRFRGHDLGEAVYWCFLGCYGLVFPGYLWLHGFPGNGAGFHPRRKSLAILAVVVVVAFPMYWMGFAEKQPVWIVPGVLILLASRLLVRSEPRTVLKV
jgi:hypothetical protein